MSPIGTLRASALFFGCFLLACGDDVAGFDGGPDAGPNPDASGDVGLPDGGGDVDDGPDAGPDAGEPDAGEPDAGGPDSGPDAGPGLATLSVIVESVRLGGGMVVSDTSIDCGSSCVETLALDSVITLTPTADAGSDFLGFVVTDGTMCPAVGDCTVTLTENTTVTARFDGGPPPMATLTIVNEGIGAGSGTITSDTSIDCGATCSEELPVGTMVVLSGTAAGGSNFLGFESSDGSECPATGDCTITLGADTTVTGRFESGPTTATITVVNESIRSGGGTITSDRSIDCGATCTETLEVGTTVTFTGTAIGGSDFLGFTSSDGTVCPAMGDCTIMLAANTTITGRFDGGPVMGTLNVVIEGRREGDGSVVSNTSIDCGSTCSETIAHGTDVTLMAVPDAGSQFVGFESSDGTACAAMADCTISISEDTIVTAQFLANPRITFNPEDRDPDVRLRYDNLGADLDDAGGSVRSTEAIAPGSGVFYFEGHRLIDELGGSGVAVATSTFDINNTYCGQTRESVGIAINGGISFGGFDGFFPAVDNEYYGFIVDYRGVNPVIYLVVKNGFPTTVPVIHSVRTMDEVTTDLYFMACGGREIVGSEVAVNPGNDTTNFPFHYDPEALLRAAMIPAYTEVADALVMGWGRTYAGPVDAPPTITASADITITLGDTVNLAASAVDAEDGFLMIRWDLLASGYYLARVTGTGPTFSFTPGDEGVHQVRAWVYDFAGNMREHIIRVTVSNPLPQYDPVRLVPDSLTGTGIILSVDGLSTRYTGLGKMGIRANQGLLTEFQYFEATRHRAPVNMGSGMVVGWGNLNPFDWDDVPQSLVVNMQGGSWQNLVPRGSIGDASTTLTYGYAVDYRGPTPTVYILTEDGLVDTIDLFDVTTPLYPVLYGNPTDTVDGSYDESLNFGTTPFAYDPATVLAAEGIDVTELGVGWGDANTTP